MTIGFLGGKLCVEKCLADVLQPLLCCPVAVLLRSNHSQVKALQGWQGEWEATAGSHTGSSSYLLRLITAPGAAQQIQQLLQSSLLPPWWKVRK